jgi:DNA polymerase
MPIPTIDAELYSEAGFVWSEPTERYPLGRWVAPEGAKEPGIAAVGAPAYCEHPSTEILTVSYDLVDGRGVRRWQPGQTLPWDLMNHLSTPDAPIEAHNAMFERLWVEHIAGPRHGWVVPRAEQWRCSMATALVAQRPAALGSLTEVLGLADQKDKEGKRLIKKFCIPQQPIPGLIDKRTGKIKRADVPARRIFPHDDPEDFENLCLYCDRDVMAEMGAMAVLPPMEDHEITAWQVTQSMNHLGMAVDRDGLETCIYMLGQVLERYGRECEEITGFRVTQLEKIKKWIAERMAS